MEHKIDEEIKGIDGQTVCYMLSLLPGQRNL